MANVVQEIHDGRDGVIDAEGGATEYTRVFRVRTDNNYTEANAILGLTDIPLVGSPYPYDAGAWLRKKSAANQSYSKRIWLVTCWYSSRVGAGSTPDGQPREDPLAEPCKVTFGSEPYEMPLKFDAVNGSPVVNAATDPYMPPVMFEQYRRVWTVEKNIRDPDNAGWAAIGTINAAGVTFDGGQGTIAAYAGLLRGIQVSAWQERNGIIFYTASLSILGPRYHNDPSEAASHKVEVLNQGMYCWRPLATPSGGQTPDDYYQPCIDDTGAPATSPKLLDASGRQQTGRGQTPIWQYYYATPPLAWSGVVPGVS